MPPQKTGKSTLNNRLEDAKKTISHLEEELRLLKLENESLKQIINKTSVASPNVNAKGCTCKGNCSSKICGCVKKHNHCGDLCKCNNVSCQNQLQGNENIVEKNDTPQKISTKISKHSARNKITNKQPNVLKDIENVQLHDKRLEQVQKPVSIFSPDVEEQHSIKYDNYELEDMIMFDNVRVTLNFDSTAQPGLEDIEKPKEPHNARKKKYSKKVRSSSYEENPMSTLNLPDNINGKKRSASIELEISEDQSSKGNPMKKAVILKDEGSKKNSKTLKKLLNAEPTKRRAKNKTKHPENPESVPVIITDDANALSENNCIIQNEKPITKIEAERSPGESAYLSAEEQNILLTNNSELDKSFNPMKPRHQLPRSPAGSMNYSRTLNTSDTPINSLAVENVDECPPPPDIDKPEVDWEEHKAQLVQCKLCKRSFFPHRVKKHELNCKKT